MTDSLHNLMSECTIGVAIFAILFAKFFTDSIFFFFAIYIHAKLASGSVESLQNLRWRERHGCDLPVQFLHQRLSLLPEGGREKEPCAEHGRGVEPHVPAGDE